MKLSVLHNPDEGIWKDLTMSYRSSLYDQRPWQQTIEKNFGNIRAHRFVLTENGQPAGGVTLFQTESFLTGKRLTTDPFHLPATTFVQSESHLDGLIREVSKWAARRGIDTVEWTLPSDRFRTLFDRHGFSFDQHYFYPVLSLGNSYQETFNGYKKQFRTNLRNTIRIIDSDAGIQFRAASPPKILGIVYRLLLTETKKRYCNLLPPLSFFTDLRARLENGNRFRIYTICHRQKIVAANLILIHKDTAYYGWSAVDSCFRDLSIASYLLDRVIRSFHDLGLGIRYVDLGPVSPYSKGLYFFKSRWGADFYQPYRFYRNVTGKPVRRLDASAEIGAARKFVRYIPDPLFRVVIDYGYKYLV